MCPGLMIACIHFLRFDKRITNFAEDKFGRDGIDVKTGYKVVKVSKDAITMQNPGTGDISVPYGMAVWSTGIGTRPFIVEFMKQIGQVHINSVSIKFSAAVKSVE